MDSLERQIIDSYQRDVARLRAERDMYKMGLERLASSECMHSPGTIDPELRMRLNYAEAILKRE